MLLAAATLLSGCSSMIADNLPTIAGGLPPGTPARSDVQPAYPAVHDMPAQRSEAVLTDAEVKQLEADLAKDRERVGAPVDQTGTTKKRPTATRRTP